MKSLSVLLALCLLFSVRSLALKPFPNYIAKPSDYGMTYEANLISNNDVQLASWYCYHEGKKDARTVMICTGDFGNMSYQLPRADSLYKRGFDVILFDYRGFGESSATQLDSNALVYEFFADDFAGAYTFYKEKLAGEPIHVLSLSMGAMVVTLANAKTADLLNGGLAFDGYIFSVSHTVELLRQMKGRSFFANISIPEYEMAQKKLFEKPALLFQGSGDLISAPADYNWQSIGNWAKKDFNGGHLQGMTNYTTGDGTMGYFKELDEFFRKK